MPATHMICAIGIILALLTVSSRCTKPNIVFILTDDQDTVLGGEIPIAKTRALIGDAGITFKNAFVTSPLCCPSRASILTGRYVHNNGAVNNSLSGGCNSKDWRERAEPRGFAPVLQSQGYRTLFAGKYLNQYIHREGEGLAHIPPGWDRWFALAGNSRYYGYTVSNNGVKEKHRDNYTEDYFTDRIRDQARQFLDEHEGSAPFFMMLSVPACHSPFDSAPQYADSFEDVQPPKNGSYNTVQMDKHWLMRQVINPMDEKSENVIEQIYRDRWRTLLSVDDMVEDIVRVLKDKDWLENTYLFFTSDNGYHFGQFSLPIDKRQLYEFDIRVPFMVRGPGVKAAQVREEIVLNIDLAPTFIDLAGAEIPEIMDGASMKEILQASDNKVVSWREEFLVEHQGEYREVNHCPQWKGARMADSYNNTYTCVRRMAENQNLIYCEFKDNESFVEAYDLTADPHEMHNIAGDLSSDERKAFKERLQQLSTCAGPGCRK